LVHRHGGDACIQTRNRKRTATSDGQRNGDASHDAAGLGVKGFL
jgi:hypothetical protein